MRKPTLNLLLVIVMLFALSPASLASATAGTDEPVAPGDREAPSHLEEVPADIQAVFEGGMSAEEFVQQAGYVPKALEGLVEGEALMIIEMEREPLSTVYAEQKAAGVSASSASLDVYRSGLVAAQTTLESALAGMGVTVISHYTTVYNGMQVLVPYSKLNEIRELPGVKAIHAAPIHEPALSASVPLIGASDVQEYGGFDGKDVAIAVIDTGIDYTHAVFGGPGEALAYSLNDPDYVESGTFPTEKVVAGYDFAGTSYDAGGTGNALIPVPDDDPLDEYGHGTHVASIAAGIAAGQVMTGVAPAADLIALKVFGADGSTSLVVDALEWATLHYIYYGTPQVINMSLGSDFGTGSLADPDVEATQNAVDAGIVVVASSGNAGDTSYITGSPATADGAISVAASTTGYATGPTVNVTGTAYVTQTNILYTPDAFTGGGDFTTPVVAPLGWVGSITNSTTLCDLTGIAANALAGKIALISRGTCDFASKVDNAAELGAVAALIYNNASGIITMAGEPASAIPAGSLQQGDGLNLAAADGETVVVSAEDDVTTTVDPYTPADTIGSFSSRGPRGVDSFLKPEITAPGVAIFAANMGSGTNGVSMSGTSMAAPHVAGVAALMVQSHPDWTPEQIKAAIMNTAADMADAAPIPLSGAGRVDAAMAVSTNATAIGDPDLVSLNWGVITTSDVYTVLTKTITLRNDGVLTDVYHVAPRFQRGSHVSGAHITIVPRDARIAPGESAVFQVILELDMTAIPAGFGSVVEEYYGYVIFGHEDRAFGQEILKQISPLRVPFYFQPRPYTELTLDADTTIAPSTTDTAMVVMTHTGAISSSLWIYPALAWNETPDPDMAGPGDVRMFGMDFGWTDDTYGDMMDVAIDAWDAWHVPQTNFTEFDLYLDVDEDGTDDFVDFNYNYGAANGGDSTNDWVVLQVELATGDVYMASPYLIYTDYNSSLMEYYLPVDWHSLDSTDNPDFDYTLVGFDAGGDRVGAAGSYDYTRAPFIWATSNTPGPDDRTAYGVVMIYDVDGYDLSQPEGLMLVDYSGDPHNVDGGQAYFLPLETEWPDHVYLPIYYYPGAQ